MSAPGIATTADLTFRELLDYTAWEAERWREYFAAHPEALDFPFASGPTATVRGVVQHIFAVERRYADRLSGVPVSTYDVIPTGSAEALFAAGRDARAALEQWLASGERRRPRAAAHVRDAQRGDAERDGAEDRRADAPARDPHLGPARDGGAAAGGADARGARSAVLERAGVR